MRLTWLPGPLKCPRNIPPRLPCWNSPALCKQLPRVAFFSCCLLILTWRWVSSPHAVMGGPGWSQKTDPSGNRKIMPTLAVLSGLPSGVWSRPMKGALRAGGRVRAVEGSACVPSISWVPVPRPPGQGTNPQGSGAVSQLTLGPTRTPQCSSPTLSLHDLE